MAARLPSSPRTSAFKIGRRRSSGGQNPGSPGKTDKGKDKEKEKDENTPVTTTDSANPSSRSPSKNVDAKTGMTFPGVANMFIRLRRVQSGALSAEQQRKAHHVVSSSSDDANEEITQFELPVPLEPSSSDRPSLTHRKDRSSGSMAGKKNRASLSLHDVVLKRSHTFVCDGNGGVNVLFLLGAVRRELMEEAQSLGGNALVKERWSSTIIGPKNRSFRVAITYSATPYHIPPAGPTGQEENTPPKVSPVDPHRPPALERAKGVDGLMTILRREA